MISNEDFSLSQLEIGAGGILFALGDNASGSNPQLAIVNDPDNPTTTSSGYSPANGMSFPLSNQLGTGLYYHGMRLIPDQIESIHPSNHRSYFMIERSASSDPGVIAPTG